MNESEAYGQSIVEAFEWAVKLLWHENLKPSEFVRIAVELQKLKKIKAPKHFWQKWPIQPTTFPLYMRAGMSALDVANQFRQSIDGCIQIGKVQSVGMPSDYNALSDEFKLAWMKATLLLVDGICKNAVAVERFREVDLMRRKVVYEIKQWQTDGYVEIAKEKPLMDNDVGLLETMLEMGLSSDSIESLEQILKRAKWTSNGKHALDRLKDYGYVAAKRGVGFYLTQSGIDRAEKLGERT